MRQKEKMRCRSFTMRSAHGRSNQIFGIRIFTGCGKTREELEDVNARILKKLEADTYRAAIFLNESQQEWRSVYSGAEKQLQKGVHALPGLPLKATLLAAGNPFHFSCLEDQTGDFLGTTACGGNVIFDEFTRNIPASIRQP